jgi:tripartite-type tricarboxylate transporter receptor subunit TctC
MYPFVFRRTFTRITLLGFAFALHLSAAVADEYPSKPIQIIVPWPAGGVVDVVARIVGQQLALRLGQSVIIVNRLGAGGNIGTEVAAKSAPDGYTLLITGESLTLNHFLFKKLPYSSDKSFVPVVLMSEMPMVLTVGKSVPAKSFSDLINLARSRPGTMSYASAGIGSSSHLITETLKRAAAIDVVQIPYQGAPPAITDLLSDRVQFFFTNPAIAIPLIKSGQVHGYAVTSTRRLAILPDVPTVTELAYPQVTYSSWIGMFAPTGTPVSIVKKVNQNVNEILSDPAITEKLKGLGLERIGGESQRLSIQIKTDLAKWPDVVRDTKITIE